MCVLASGPTLRMLSFSHPSVGGKRFISDFDFPFPQGSGWLKRRLIKNQSYLLMNWQVDVEKAIVQMVLGGKQVEPIRRWHLITNYETVTSAVEKRGQCSATKWR